MMHTPPRPGFTLLEVLLASVIALLLLAALYVSFDLTLRQMDDGRDAIAQAAMARAVVNRMNIDLSCCIGPMPPKSGGGIPEDTFSPSANSQLSSEELAAGVATGTVDLGDSEGTLAADLPFQGGLFGSENEVTLFVSRVPPALAFPETADVNAGGFIDMRPDLRRVTYYLGSNGLCRQERPWVTADGVRNSAEADRSDESLDLIAEEVTSVSFSYFDGSGWVSVWTGSDPSTDGNSVIGPPRAIRITMTIQLAGGGEPRIVTHVIPIRAAVGLYRPPAAEEETVPDPTVTGS